MTNRESVNLPVLEHICAEQNCDFADLVNYKMQEEKSFARWNNSHFPLQNKEG